MTSLHTHEAISDLDARLADPSLQRFVAADGTGRGRYGCSGGRANNAVAAVGWISRIWDVFPTLAKKKKNTTY